MNVIWLAPISWHVAINYCYIFFNNFQNKETQNILSYETVQIQPKAWTGTFRPFAQTLPLNPWVKSNSVQLGLTGALISQVRITLGLGRIFKWILIN